MCIIFYHTDAKLLDPALIQAPGAYSGKYGIFENLEKLEYFRNFLDLYRILVFLLTVVEGPFAEEFPNIRLMSRFFIPL